MKKIFIVFILLNSIVLFAEAISREDAVEYYKQKSKIVKSNIIETKNYRDQINPDFNINKKYTVISLTGKDTYNKDLKYIKSFPEVEVIHLSEAINLKDKDLEFMSDLLKLRKLNFDSTNINGIGFKSLNNLPVLEEIDLSFTKVSDSNLQELKKFKTLKNIWLYKSRVTQKGVNMLQKELPDCFISLKPQD